MNMPSTAAPAKSRAGALIAQRLRRGNRRGGFSAQEARLSCRAFFRENLELGAQAGPAGHFEGLAKPPAANGVVDNYQEGSFGGAMAQLGE